MAVIEINDEELFVCDICDETVQIDDLESYSVGINCYDACKKCYERFLKSSFNTQIYWRCKNCDNLNEHHQETCICK